MRSVVGEPLIKRNCQSPVRQSAIPLRPSVQEMLVHLKINRIWNLKLTFPTRKNPIGPKTSWNIFGRGSIRFKSQNLSHWETKDTWQVGPWTVDFVKFETNQIRKNTFVRQRRYVLHICREIFASWKFKLCDGHNVTLKMQKNVIVRSFQKKTKKVYWKQPRWRKSEHLNVSYGNEGMELVKGYDGPWDDICFLCVCIFLFAFVFEDESKVAVAPGAGGWKISTR